ncbi:ATP-dependent RNA helicase TDRD9 isoform X2 [Strongylocentrotus purpuratus]|uniref:ATP-dependent RNA helicase TDRD9 n=1 Tax=Strongylocentrotus purpuratus TaxID=7668 RepID=A0A7M7HFY8_STRPU|nr:ATP-dependent RNA helicase TDRD9 isoform X2 [Strongylocentrotus purpuratus]|eukprot:XP_011664855.1 PREDICTED: putative ATP-dependent RNA helicase TDRD9 isoform X2 [Strongylocentrotus purpuratus]
MARFLTAEASFEDIDDWFKIGKAKPSFPAVIPASATGGTGKLRTERYEESLRKTRARQGVQTRPKPETVQSGKAYANHYRQQWDEQQLEDDISNLHIDEDKPLPSSAMSDLESMSVTSARPVLPDETSPEVAVQAYDNYNFDHTYNEELPITKHKDQVLNTIESNQVTIIQGSTGCGKTTQVPQYILDDYVCKRKHCNIVVTQPRKIAAISIARRVCEERRWQLGSLVGYRVGMDKTTSPDTRLTYMTTGVLLQKLINKRNMTEYTHIILDEVHERDLNTDFAMLVVRKLQRTNSRHVKVILMSATIDVSLFGEYFALPVRGSLEMPPVVSVEGKVFDVEEAYLDNLTRFGLVPRHRPDMNPTIYKETYDLAKNLVCHFDNMERQEQGIPANTMVKKRGTVLVFLPGIREIEDFEKLLPGQGSKERLIVIPLHSSITTQEQARAFIRPEEGFRKVILSTNIAESSITVPDIKYVIDFMLLKCMVCDVETNYQSLQLNWASKANAQQRKGRAGRVSSGQVYRLIHKAFYEEYIDEYAIPEILRCPLEQLILQVKVLDLGEPKAILALALEPPNLDNIERTILLLKEVGGLTTIRSSVANPHDGELTFVGRVLASLPVDIRIGKLLVLGHVFGCLKECLVIGAGLSLKSFFSQPFKRALEAYKSKLKWDAGSFSDPVAILNAYREWERCRDNGFFARHRRAERDWADERMIQLNPLREVSKLVAELEDRLSNFNIRLQKGNPRNQQKQDPTHNLLILKVVLAGAFYPNFFTWVPSDEADSLKILSGKDPCTTVMVKNIPPHGELYSSSIGKLFQCCGKGKKLFFEDTKLFVQFERQSDYSPILPAVYHAVKMRHLKMPLQLDVFEVDKDTEVKTTLEERHLRSNRMAVSINSEGPKQVPLPDASTDWSLIMPTAVADGNRFWAHYMNEETIQIMLKLLEKANDAGYRELESLDLSEVREGDLVLAPFTDANQTRYFRAKILQMRRATRDSIQGNQVEVFFVDYGNRDVVPEKYLRYLPKPLLDIPFQAFECVLAHIKPLYKLPHNQWLPKARKVLEEHIIQNIPFQSKIFSVVDGVVRLDLYNTHVEPEVHIQEVLIQMEIAEHAEEPHLSKVNHLQREIAREETRRMHIDHPEQVPASLEEESWTQMNVRQSDQGRRKRRGKVYLNGPNSPYEINFASMTRIGRLKTCRVDRASVNSVALSTEPEDKHEKMMVSAHVGLNPSGSVLQARNTTLMPNISDLPALVCMLFAPTVEFRTDRKMTRLTGLLCGLGWDPVTQAPMLADHDIELAFDTKIRNEDVSKMNGLRFAINLALASKDYIAMWGANATHQIQCQARDALIGLFTAKRSRVEPLHYTHCYAWDQLEEASVMPIKKEDYTSEDFPMLYQFHNGVFLESPEDPEEDEEVAMLKDHVADLYERASRSTVRFVKPITCILCQVLCFSPRDLYYHLQNTAHLDREQALDPPPLV